MKQISIIRDRGQLTIPDQIRKVAGWTGNLSAVTISLEKSDQIIISPFHASKEVEWEKIHDSIRKARDIKGKGRESGSEFIEKERRG